MPDANFTGTANLQIITNDLASTLVGRPENRPDTVAINVSVPTEYSGLLATYYNNTDLSGTGIQRIDPSIDFNSQGDWGRETSPAPRIAGTNWSALLARQNPGHHDRRHTRSTSPATMASGSGSTTLTSMAGLTNRAVTYTLHDQPGGRAMVRDPHGVFPGRRR